MTAQEMVKRQETRPAQSEDTRTLGRVWTPAVDIFESDETITLVADMPGVDKQGLDISLEKGVLTLNGEVSHQSHGKSLLREFSAANYYRQFRISEFIDADKAKADLKNGVLTLEIPKAESAKPKKITIKH